MGTCPTSAEMISASNLLSVLAVPRDEVAHLHVGRAGGSSITIPPALAATLRDMLAMVACGDWPEIYQTDQVEPTPPQGEFIRKDRVIAMLSLIRDQEQGCGGNLSAKDVACNMKRLAALYLEELFNEQ